jgi:aspartyl-tRNA(Asn)/glutamyl-tRNA(Gln) amidotransferase subunit C
MISKEEVQHIAKLARLELTEQEFEKLQKEMSAILDYFDLLKSAPPAVGEDVATSKNLNALRFDQITPRVEENTKKLLADAPDKKDDYIKVKAIF